MRTAIESKNAKKKNERREAEIPRENKILIIIMYSSHVIRFSLLLLAMSFSDIR